MHKTTFTKGYGTLLAVMLTTACSTSIDTDIEGQWVGTDAAGHAITMQFSNEDVALTQDDRTLVGTWTLDSSRDPAHLTLKMHTPSGHLQTVPAIAEMVSMNKLRLRVGSNLKTRPTRFDKDGAPNQILLERAK